MLTPAHPDATHASLAPFRRALIDELTKQAIAGNASAPEHWDAPARDTDRTTRVMTVDEGLVIDVDRLLTAVLDAAADHLYAFAKTATNPQVFVVSQVNARELADGIVSLRRAAIEAAADEIRITPRAEAL
jgi:hypothetical protein